MRMWAEILVRTLLSPSWGTKDCGLRTADCGLRTAVFLATWAVVARMALSGEPEVGGT